MSVLHSILFGMFVLILIYLAVKNASGATGILTATGTEANTLTKTLQGR